MFCYYDGKVENPCEKCERLFGELNNPRCYCDKRAKYNLHQSIISKLVPVNLDKMLDRYHTYRQIELLKIEENHLQNNALFEALNRILTFEQFIQQQMNLSNKSNSSQEGKTKYQATYNQDGSIDVYPQEASHDKDS